MIKASRLRCAVKPEFRGEAEGRRADLRGDSHLPDHPME